MAWLVRSVASTSMFEPRPLPSPTSAVSLSTWANSGDLIVHGENDRQIPVAYAHRSYEQAVNSPKLDLRVFTPDEGGAEHVGLDHLPHVSTYVADWVADTFEELQ
jgi:fermentation-respiration switch protein FrsA (DUF1100 family)